MAASSQNSPNHAAKKPDNDLTSGPGKSGNLDSDAPKGIGKVFEHTTYEQTESSESFIRAKSLLSQGDFDAALDMIGNSLENLMSNLPEEIGELHESLAPLYYLYGTTLLYSKEESTDNLQAASVEADDADDSQIAWENLETARYILDNLIKSCQEERRSKLKLDLAQIHLRLGDLQRANGRYKEAIADYTKCLEIRQPNLGQFHTKVADTHYNLGLTFMSMASEGDKQAMNNPVTEKSVASPTVGSLDKSNEEYRNKALKHYFVGAKSFAGEIALICGLNPEEIVNKKQEEQSEKVLATMASSALQKIRSDVAPLHSKENESKILNLKEILDEIQEIIDEAESAKKAIVEVAELKAKAQAAVEGVGESLNPDGSTTTIGFGKSKAPEPSSPQPMMVVRKKKKRSNEDRDLKNTVDDSSKVPKIE